MSSSAANSNVIPQFLAGKGEMAKLTREFDWSQTSIGPIDTWPQSLRTTLSIMLSSKFPMLLMWGEELLVFYNDALRPSYGENGMHPSALGERADIVWADMWPIISGDVYSVKRGAEATWKENQATPFYRNGKLETVYWTYSYTPVLDESGKVGGVLSIVNETTETVEAVKNLKVSNDRFQNLVREATVGIVVLTGPEMCVNVVNESYARLTMRTANEMLNKPLFSMIPESESTFRPILEQVVNTGEPVFLYDYPYHIISNGERTEGFLNVVYQPYKDSDGSTTGVMVLCHDVTAQVVAQQEIEQQKTFLQNAIDIANFGTYKMDMVTGITTFSDNIKTLFHTNDTHKATEELLKLVHPDDVGNIAQIIGDSFVSEEKSEHHSHYRMVSPTDGSIRYVHSIGKSIIKDGAPYSITGIIQDVTEQVVSRKKLEESELNLRNVFAQAPVGMALYRKPNFVVDIANSRFLERIGRIPEQALGYSIFDVLPEVKNDIYLKLMTDVLLTGKTFSAYGVPVTIRKNGIEETQYVSFTYEAYRDLEGEIVGVMEVSNDVTDEMLSRKKLEESELFARSIVANSDVAQAIWVGEDMVFHVINQRMLKIFGRDESIIGMKYMDAIPELRDTPLMEQLRHVLHTGDTIQRSEIPFTVNRQGVPYTGYFSYTYKPLTNAAGENYGVICTAYEVTDQVNARKKVEESELYARSLIEYSPVAQVVFTGMDMVMSTVNERMLEMLGRDTSIIGKPFMEAIPELKATPLLERLQKVLVTGETFVTPEERLELIKHGQSHIGYYNYTYQALPNTAGENYAIICTATEVTAQVMARKMIEEAEQEIRNTAERLELALDAAKLGSYELTLADGIMMCNEQCRRNLQFPLDAVLTFDKFIDIIVADDRDRMKTAVNESIANNTVFECDYRIYWDDGSLRWIKAAGKPVYAEDGTPLKMVGISLDITEQQLFAETLSKQVKDRTLELQRSNDDLQQFAHVASHDLKEPVRKIKLFSGRIQSEYGSLLPETGQLYLAKVQSATDRMLSMIEGVLAYSSMNVTAQPTIDIDLNKIFSDITSDLEVLIAEKHGIITKENLPHIQGVYILVYQLFYNIINNSLKFSKIDVSPAISISSTMLNGDNGPCVQLTIEDNGIGFAQEYATTIFTTFTRLNSKDKYEGTGLGLALCKKIVERHNGKIFASSKKDVGAVFTVILPLTQTQPII